MKTDALRSALVAIVLSVAVAISGIGCLVTAFSLPAPHWGSVLLILCAAAVISTACLSVRWGIVLHSAVASFSAYCFIRSDSMMISLEALLYRITKVYDMGYNWGYIHWSSADLSGASLDGALCALGCVIVMAVCFCICRRKWLGIGLIPGLLPLFACCVVTDTIPGGVYLWLLLTALLLLVLTQLTRRSRPADANRLTAIFLIPVILVTSLSYALTPKTEPQEQSGDLQTALMQIVSQLADLFPNSFGSDGIIPTRSERLDLSTVGPRDPGRSTAMYLDSSYTGTVYLRGQSYDRYTGTRWESQIDTAGEGGWPDGGLRKVGQLSIRTVFMGNFRYFPYYIADENWTEELSDGALSGIASREYSYDWYTRPSNASGFTPLSGEELEAYLQLPDSTAAAAAEILERLEINDLTPKENAVRQIRNYVRFSASYSLDTEAMPEDADDFAIWFLTESESGYCVHFATAATVLLRAAGVPARYVTGYRGNTISGKTTTVTADQAHAWVEYLDPDCGWTVLEVTPSADSPTVPSTTEPETTLPQTSAPTESSQPTEPSGTSLPTESSGVTEPSGSTAAPPESTAPSTTTNPTEITAPGSQDPGKARLNLQWLKVLLWILLIWAVIAVQDRLRRRSRRRRMYEGNPNSQALARWRYAKLLSRLSGVSAAALLPLAEKAAFSQYELTDEELKQFDQWLHSARRALRGKPWPLRAAFRLIFAID